jgi:hypothetical protein
MNKSLSIFSTSFYIIQARYAQSDFPDIEKIDTATEIKEWKKKMFCDSLPIGNVIKLDCSSRQMTCLNRDILNIRVSEIQKCKGRNICYQSNFLFVSQLYAQVHNESIFNSLLTSKTFIDKRIN